MLYPTPPLYIPPPKAFLLLDLKLFKSKSPCGVGKAEPPPLFTGIDFISFPSAL